MTLFRARGRLPVALLAVGLALLVLTAPAHASARLHEKMKPVAEKIIGVLDQEQQPACVVADIPPDPLSGSNSGPGLRQILIEELVSARKGVVLEKATIVVNASYAAVDVEDPTKQSESRVV